MNKKIIHVLFLICIFFQILHSKTFIREYTYQASEADSKITSRAIALEQVKRLLLEEIGMYVHATVQNEEIEVSGEVRELTSKQIEIISAGITETEILEETWNGEIYYIKAEIQVDENDVLKRLDNAINAGQVEVSAGQVASSGVTPVWCIGWNPCAIPPRERTAYIHAEIAADDRRVS